MSLMSPKEAGFRLQKIHFRFLGMDEFSEKCIAVRKMLETEIIDMEKMRKDNMSRIKSLISIIITFFDDEPLLKNVFNIADAFLLFNYHNQILRSFEYLCGLKTKIILEVPDSDSAFFNDFALINITGIQ